jgi:hypothetical protein
VGVPVPPGRECPRGKDQRAPASFVPIGMPGSGRPPSVEVVSAAPVTANDARASLVDLIGFGRLPQGRCRRRRGLSAAYDSYLVDSASSHMLVSKIKPCMSKYKQVEGETANGSLYKLSSI